MSATLPLSEPHVELDFLELWVGDADKTSRILTACFGFQPTGTDVVTQQDENIAGLSCGKASLVIRQGTAADNPIARYVTKHGDSVGDVALVCDDVGAVVDRALIHGLTATYEGGCPRLDVLGDGLILHTLRDRSNDRATVRATAGAGSIRAIDHISYCLPWGTMERVARIYSKVFGFEHVRVDNCREVGGSAEGMRSTVLRSPLGFAIVLTEPMSSASTGQTQRFLEAHAGPGVQHVAFAYDDLIAAATSLRAKGVAFLPIPEEHLECSHQRLRDHALPWQALRRNEILVDADEKGLLFQLFTLPITDRSIFFVELIQREGATGFGANNVRGLFAAVDAGIRDRVEPLWNRVANVRRAWTEDLVHAACAKIPFYRDHLDGADPSNFAALPSFNKSVTAGYGRFPLSSGRAEGAHRVVATSGTTGDRLYVSFEEVEWNRTANWLKKVGQRAGLTPDDVLLNTHCYGLWVGGPALDLLAHRCGAGLIPLGPGGPAGVLQLLADGIGTAISATPSYLRRIIEAAHATGFDLTKTSLRYGFIGAEIAEESLRRKLMAQLPKGFLWIELYGLTETGGPAVASAPDPSVAELEVNTEEFWIEVLDRKEDRPVPMGDIGELTITTRRTDGRTPLIRYRTCDLVRATAGPAEAPTRISRILGRTDESLKIGGVLVYPSAIAEIMSQFIHATAEWRATVIRRESDNELIVEAEASPDLCRLVKHAFQDRVGVGLTISPVEPGALARSRHKTQRILIESSTRAKRSSMDEVPADVYP